MTLIFRPITFVMFVFPLFSPAATVQSVASGNWESGAVWSTGSVPTCGDNIIIQTGHLITVSTNNSTLNSCGSASYVLIYGTLDFGNGDKLHMGCGSGIGIETGGSISAAGSGGGNSNQITICGATEWSKSDGTLTGPSSVGAIILPIKLLDFRAGSNDKNITITWSTATEINNDHFVLFKSTDGMSWSKFATIDGAGNSDNVREYTASDVFSSVTTYYYRLVQVDFNGSSTTYGPIKINYSGLQDVQPYPNPSAGVLYLNNLPVYDTHAVAITDLNGRIMAERFLDPGNNHIDLTDLPTGLYMLSLSNETEVIHKQIQIR